MSLCVQETIRGMASPILLILVIMFLQAYEILGLKWLVNVFKYVNVAQTISQCLHTHGVILDCLTYHGKIHLKPERCKNNK